MKISCKPLLSFPLFPFVCFALLSHLSYFLWLEYDLAGFTSSARDFTMHDCIPSPPIVSLARRRPSQLLPRLRSLSAVTEEIPPLVSWEWEEATLLSRCGFVAVLSFLLIVVSLFSFLEALRRKHSIWRLKAFLLFAGQPNPSLCSFPIQLPHPLSCVFFFSIAFSLSL